MANNKHSRKENIVYMASRALWKAEKRPTRRIGPITRWYNFTKQKRAAKRDMKGKSWWIAEKRRARIMGIFADTCSPLYNAWMELWDTLYNFLAKFFEDLGAIFGAIGRFGQWLGYHIQSIFIAVSDKIADIGYWFEGRKRGLFALFTFLTIALVAAVVFMSSITAYEYSYYGRTLGLTKSKKMVYDTIDVIGDKLAIDSGTNVAIDPDRDIKFKKIRGFNIKTDNEDDILNVLTYMRDLQVNACAINVGGVEKVIVEDEDVAREILADIKAYFAGEKPGVEYTDVHYDKDVSFTEVSVKLAEVWSKQNAEKYLMTGTIIDKVHVVNNNESYNEILEMYGMTRKQLEAANPDVDLESLTPGMELYLSERNPIITIYSTETATYLENIQYGSQYINNGAIYEGETEVRTPGIFGKNEVVATITRVNGKETSKKVISTTKVSNPVDEVVYRGTKPIPEKIGTGTFANPMRTYRVTSELGWRWGRAHEGIDLGASTGTKIYASDGGVVTYSGWKNGLGYCVYIDHGGLYTTVYGHCSKLLVTAGENVYQGQNIALVGNTGNSTGPHLHFEVRYNGNAMNPRDYVSF